MAPETRFSFARRGTIVALFALVAVSAGQLSCSDHVGPDTTCTITLTPPARAFTADGGDASVSIAASASSCAWTATLDANWVAFVTAPSGTGNGALTYRVSANPQTAPRAATLAIGGTSHPITQAAAQPVDCSVTLTPTTAMFDDRGGTGTVQVASPDVCTWTAVSQAAFLSVTSGASGTGNGTVAYTVAENNTSADRSGTLLIGGETFTVSQTSEPVSCDYAVSPTAFTPCMPAGTTAATVTAPQGCPWTVSTSVPWLTVTSGDTGSGTGQIQVAFSSNYDAPRSGTVMVRWPTPTAGQNLQVDQAGCMYGVSQSAFVFPAGGGNGSFMVLQQSDPIVCGGPLQNACVWTPTTNVSWIMITTPGQHVGDDNVSFTVAPNGTGSGRVGTIQVRDRTIQVTQN